MPKAATTNKNLKKKTGASKGQAQVAPVAVSTSRVGRSPTMGGSNASYRVTHSELITQLEWDGTDTYWAYTVNPSSSELFPWLSRIAGNFETYRFTALRFEWRPRVSTTTSGLVVQAFEPDPDDEEFADPTTARQALAVMPAFIETSVWAKADSTVPSRVLVERQAKGLFVRDLSDGTAESRTRDLGRYYVCLFGLGVSAMTAGDVFVHYSVEFSMPQVQIASTINDVVAPELLFSSTDTSSSDTYRAFTNANIPNFQSAPTAVNKSSTGAQLWDLVSTGSNEFWVSALKSFQGATEVWLDKLGLSAASACTTYPYPSGSYTLARKNEFGALVGEAVNLTPVLDTGCTVANSFLYRFRGLVGWNWTQGTRYRFELLKDGVLVANAAMNFARLMLRHHAVAAGAISGTVARHFQSRPKGEFASSSKIMTFESSSTVPNPTIPTGPRACWGNVVP